MSIVKFGWTQPTLMLFALLKTNNGRGLKYGSTHLTFSLVLIN